ncbi:hypothetical protein [Aquimarina sp. MMG016]|uniref:hypothetical protein n=1 Tax=Aquimarina sp. MMG016 TaxID=2822690 RepID=UPI001B3A0F7D|nr:hypothetical protein [Aquimarina sp. MMG016]MBQ4819863.1 hypothetical protein [Aquimarina sp. MMG016]
MKFNFTSIQTRTCRRPFLLLMALAFMTTGVSNAQFGKLLKKKNKSSKVDKSDPNYDPNRKILITDVPALKYDKPFPPAVMYRSFMKHIDFTSDGYLDLDYVSIGFPPKQDVDGNPEKYNGRKASGGGGIMGGTQKRDDYYRFHLRLIKEGKEVYDVCYKAQYNNELYIKFERVDFALSDRDGSSEEPYSKRKLENGKYTFEFYFDDKMFSRIPFEVVSIKNDDPYAKVAEKKFIRGVWNDYGYFDWEKNTDNPRIYWNIYAQVEELLNSKYKEVPMYCDVYKNGKYFATSGRVDQYDNPSKEKLENTWDLYRYSLMLKGKKSGDYVRQNDMTDGKYEVRMHIDGTNHIYKFEMKGGKVIGSQKRETTDPLDFMEGMNKAFFIKKQ